MRTCLLLFAMLSVAWSQDDRGGVAPMPPDQSVLAYLVIPDAQRLLAHVRFSPIAVQLATLPLARQCLKIFADVGLADLDRSRPIILAVTAPDEHGVPGFAACIPFNDDRHYRQAADAAGFSTLERQKTLGIGSDAHDLVQARSLIDFTNQPRDPCRSDVRVRFSGDRALATYGDSLRDQTWLAMMHLSQLPRPAKAPDFSPLMRCLMAALTAIGQDTQDLQVDASVSANDFDADIICTARPASPLALALVSRPAAGAPLVIPGPPAPLTSIQGSIDPLWTGMFASTLIKRIAREQNVTMDPGVLADIEGFSTSATGQAAFRVDRDPVHGVTCSYVHGVTSRQAARTLAASIIASFTPQKPLGTTSKHLGAEIHLESAPDVRMSHGVPIDHVGVSVTNVTLSSEQQAALLAFVHDGEMACTDHWLLFAQVPSQMDALVWIAQSSIENPQRTQGDDGTAGIALTCDVAGIIAASSSASGQEASATAQEFVGLAAGDPLTAAVRFSSGSAFMTLHVPTPPMATFMKLMAFARLEEWINPPK